MNRRRKKLLLITTAIAVGGYLLVAGITSYQVYSVYLPKIDDDQKQLELHQAKILADLYLLRQKPIYQKLPRERNAERFLSGFVNWSGAAPLKSIDHDHLLEFIERHPDPTKTEENWNKILDDENLDELELAWVDQLLPYDHVDFGTNPLVIDEVQKAKKMTGVDRIGSMASMPLLDMKELRYATLARVAQLEIEGRTDEMHVILRHVGYLISTTDTLVGSMFAVSMLQQETNIAKYEDTRWPLIDKDRIEAMKRVSWAWLGVVHAKARERDLAEFAPYFKREDGICSAALEGLSLESVLNDYIEPTVLFEPDLRKRMTAERETTLKVLKECAHTNYNVFLTPADSPLFIGRTINPARVPFVRRFIAVILESIATPNYYRFYDETGREPASK